MRFAYVAAIVTNGLADGPGSIAFQHTEVRAPTTEAAYTAGQRWLETVHAFKPALQTVNDYVFEIKDELRVHVAEEIARMEADCRCGNLSPRAVVAAIAPQALGHAERSVSRRKAYDVADSCRDAYSFDRYGRAGWRGSAWALAEMGLAPQEIEAVLRSKATRWAADQQAGPGLMTGAMFDKWLKAQRWFTREWIEECARQTFPR